MKPINEFYTLKEFNPTKNQRKAIETTEDPVLIIAGPGAGKTRVLLWRTFNLIVYKGVEPKNILLCTFTEKAADQLKLGLENLVDMLGPDERDRIDFSQMPIGTIHSICATFLRENVRDWRLAMKNFTVLDDITQMLFIYDNENFQRIKNGEYRFNRTVNEGGNSKTVCVSNLIAYFNKLTEEKIRPEDILNAGADSRLKTIARAFGRYEELLNEKNRVDFAHLQTKFLELLNSEAGKEIKEQIRYVMVDEYQDTNYIQELIFFTLAKNTKNLCVVGDEDQSIYRFRGATVQNLLDFSKTCRKKLGIKPKEIPLIENFRSHKDIIEAYNLFMESYEGWNENGKSFRYPGKRIQAGLKEHLDYPACFQLVAPDEVTMAKMMVQFIKRVLDKRLVDDPNRIAILMKSIRNEHFDTITAELKEAGIDYYAPRAGKFLDSKEIREIIGVYLLLLGWEKEEVDYGNWGKYQDWLEKLNLQVERELKKNYPKTLRLIKTIQAEFKVMMRDYETLERLLGASLTIDSDNMEEFSLNIKDLSRSSRNRIQRLIKTRGKKKFSKKNLSKLIALDKGLLDYFYVFMGQEPFRSYLQGKDGEGRIRNLATFSNIISMFQEYRMHRIITAISLKRGWLQRSFLNNFLYIIYQQELNEYEDRTAIIPQGSVPIMTIHQAKGLEFPVVIIGRLHVAIRDQKVERELRQYFKRKNDEPEDRIGLFDHMRLFYVAMSRAKNVLCMPNLREQYNTPHGTFNPVLNDVPSIKTEEFDIFDGLSPFKVDVPQEFKPSFGFKSDFQYFKTCPMQYKMFRYYSFAPATSSELFFGTLVHQTIDDVHHIYLSAPSREEVKIGDAEIEVLFRNNYETLRNTGLHPLSIAAQEAALEQVKEYFRNSQDLIKNVYKTEVRLLKSQDRYNLTGVIDIIANPTGEYHLYDFKAQRMVDIKKDLRFYEDQLNLYYHILKTTYKLDVSRMFIYSTHIDSKAEKIHEVKIDPARVDTLVSELDGIALRILNKDFTHDRRRVDKKVCTKCGLHFFCGS